MAHSGEHVVVPGSAKPAPAARAVGPVDPGEQVSVTLVLRRTAPRPAPNLRMSRQEYAAAHGAAAEDVTAVERVAHEWNLDVAAVDPAARTVRLVGDAKDVAQAFSVELSRYEQDGTSFRGRAGVIEIPAELDGVVTAVLGLDDRPAVRSRLRFAAAAPTSYTPVQLAALYDYPSGFDGSGQTVAIIELGGGYRAADLDEYFAQLGLRRPTVTSVSVDGGRNAPSGDPHGADAEVVLDVEVAGAVAPGARFAVYFAPNTDAGFLDAINAAVHDSVRSPSVISISWGAAESAWTAQSLTAYDDAFAVAATMGVTVLVASGDDGSSDRGGDNQPHADFPAASPHVTGCGGTSLAASGNSITSETVWNDGTAGGASGGGVSGVFGLPTWQAGRPVPDRPGTTTRGRGVPDLSADADPATGYRVRVDGTDTVVGGTSAVAPLLAGLVARYNQALGAPLGFLNPLVYALPAGSAAVRDIVVGSNGAYDAGPGWDACTGLGVPVGTPLLDALRTETTGKASR